MSDNSSPQEGAHFSSNERREIIIQTLREQDQVSVNDLSKRLNVTEVTTRKDLQLLEEQGYLTRVRGGAVMSGRGQLELRFAARQQLMLDEKRRMAKRAARYIEPGNTIFLDGSSTTFQMTRLLRDQQGITVITNGLYAALELSFAPEVTTIVVGGILRRRTSSLVDVLTPTLLRRLHVDVAFLSCRAFTMKNGMMESDLREAQIKRYMAQAAQRTFAIIDHSKFGGSYTASSLLPEEIDNMISDTGLSAEQQAQIAELGINLELA
ncbi:MAG: DeoR/GlpR transcriptional regulator [Caldilineaceae bacterium]|nr:DeoR/GlpR transcriptional regulator [Caldilineaceae bacterium]MCB9139357.1 DeoR/GlpR transcriptional regulator [Caldilineaceae bacterium]